MKCRDASLIRVVTSALLPSSFSPHLALTCPAILPGLRVWKTQSNEGMDCAMNGPRCVILTFPGLSPLVFHYNSGLARSDKGDDVAIRHDKSPQTEQSTLSCPLSFHLLGSREANGRANERENNYTGWHLLLRVCMKRDVSWHFLQIDAHTKYIKSVYPSSHWVCCHSWFHSPQTIH